MVLMTMEDEWQALNETWGVETLTGLLCQPSTRLTQTCSYQPSISCAITFGAPHLCSCRSFGWEQLILSLLSVIFHSPFRFLIKLPHLFKALPDWCHCFLFSSPQHQNGLRLWVPKPRSLTTASLRYMSSALASHMLLETRTVSLLRSPLLLDSQIICRQQLLKLGQKREEKEEEVMWYAMLF